jgi:hypothetical protein
LTNKKGNFGEKRRKDQMTETILFVYIVYRYD